MDNLKFSLQRKEKEVELTTSDGSVKKYKLKEFSGVQRKEYMARFKMDISFEDGKAVVQSAKDFKPLSETEFLTLCLYDEKDELVKEEEILKFPSAAIIGMHKAALELSGLDKASIEKAKND